MFNYKKIKRKRNANEMWKWVDVCMEFCATFHIHHLLIEDSPGWWCKQKRYIFKSFSALNHHQMVVILQPVSLRPAAGWGQLKKGRIRRLNLMWAYRNCHFSFSFADIDLVPHILYMEYMILFNWSLFVHAWICHFFNASIHEKCFGIILIPIACHHYYTERVFFFN